MTNNNWISVKDRPPEEMDWYLVWLPADDELGYVAHFEKAWWSGHDWQPDDNCGAMADGVEPTHWTLLEPPVAELEYNNE